VSFLIGAVGSLSGENVYPSGSHVNIYLVEAYAGGRIYFIDREDGPISPYISGGITFVKVVENYATPAGDGTASAASSAGFIDAGIMLRKENISLGFGVRGVFGSTGTLEILGYQIQGTADYWQAGITLGIKLSPPKRKIAPTPKPGATPADA
jgi:hypothetical protein